MKFGDTGSGQLKGLSSVLSEDQRISPCGWLSGASSHLMELSDAPAVCALPGHTGFQSSLPGHASRGEPPVSLHIPAPIASPADGAVDTQDRREHP